MRNVLIDVDVQHDFCDPSGALFVSGAERLASTFRALTAKGEATGTPIVASVDSHAFDAWEFAGAVDAGPNGERPGFPPHCVKGTAGWLKVPGTLASRARFVPNVRVDDGELEALVCAHDVSQVLLEKEVYSLFANPNAERVLDLVTRGEAPRFVVYGVAMDYCVKAACLGLADWVARHGRGEVWLVADATASVVRADTESAVAACVARGVTVVDSQLALGVL